MATGSLVHLITRLFGTPLLVHPRKLDSILTALGPRLGLAPCAIDDDYEVTAPKGRDPNTQNVAVIPVYGTLVKRSLGMAAQSGMTAYQDIGSAFGKALIDPDCRGIVFDIDSPGGEAAGVFDLAARITAARGQKPIIAIANDYCYSAAYCIASCADHVLVTGVGGVGSIGVYMLHCDASRADRQAGLKFSYIYSGSRKVDGNPHEPLNNVAIAQLQTEADRVRSMFVETVARNRGVSAQQVYETEAACYMGAKAVPLLADQIGTFEEALAFAQMTRSQRALAAARAKLRALTEPTKEQRDELIRARRQLAGTRIGGDEPFRRTK